MLKIHASLQAADLLPAVERLFDLSARKIRAIEKSWRPRFGAPVFTVRGKYAARGWTEWTQGFQFGSALLQYDATGEAEFLETGRAGTVKRMAAHVSHLGVHDHGFNNVSTYGNLRRLMAEGRVPANEWERNFYELALKASGAAQASRWTRLADGSGFIHSFNGPHSLFIDTIRSCRSLALAHQLGHVLMGEQDQRLGLLQRLVEHALNTVRYNVYFGRGRDAFDTRGRVAHEAIFNTASGVFRCPNSQQGYSAFSVWTRGLAWAITGFAELLEFCRDGVDGGDPGFAPAGGRDKFRRILADAATATADFYMAHCCADGIPMWDTGAPNLHRLPEDYLDRPSDPFNEFEPVDSSAAAIAGQGLLRLGNGLRVARYRQAALAIARHLFAEPYLSTGANHQGLILHSVYHRPNGWDYIAPGRKIPCGESSIWGDYHARELALMILREARGLPYYKFYD
jgi:hypothetical protein